MKNLILFFAVLFSTPSISQKTIAHRGAWKMSENPQNSIAALQEAARLKCFATEFDVHLTKDNILVVNHDDDFQGMKIATSTYAELLTKKLTNGEKIPTAEDYLKEGLKHKNLRLILEIKTSPLGLERTKETANAAVNLVKKLKAKKHVDFILFDFETGVYLSKITKTSIGYLTGNKTPEELKTAGFKQMDYHFSVYQKNPDYISRAKKLKLSVNCWTVNSEKDVEEMLAKNVDFITTDEPELVLEKTKK
ncbi:glycerophosphodiester phosphodiesterase [Flavobacterium sp. NST-5]|uniref:Glycerophosphodiester phosphodiesterase n=1 Tax=Flavobacterium ichthyis TaxID=2698827 RepID=A0ABW9ZA23_9FLAO|nr:glycerophosphodiester phosphodiesterase family protein [Flavobacterium ichthyis]NBL65736.1 glycerophosphodiester phosphodiesterase [Flavobacterium ichthyis]